MADLTPYDQTSQTVNIENLKTIAGASAAALAMTYQDQAASRNRMLLIGEAATSKAVERIHSFDAEEALGPSMALRGNANADVLSLLVQLAGSSLANKQVAITPPETGVSRDLAALTAMADLMKTLAGPAKA